jgi:hypothetical protein
MKTLFGDFDQFSKKWQFYCNSLLRLFFGINCYILGQNHYPPPILFGKNILKIITSVPAVLRYQERPGEVGAVGLVPDAEGADDGAEVNGLLV